MQAKLPSTRSGGQPLEIPGDLPNESPGPTPTETPFAPPRETPEAPPSGVPEAPPIDVPEAPPEMPGQPTGKVLQYPKSVLGAVTGAPPLPKANEDTQTPPEDRFEAHLDRVLHAAIARQTGGLSPAGRTEALTDWAAHLALSPGKQLQIARKAVRKWQRLSQFALNCATDCGKAPACIAPLPQDNRFAAPQWQTWPYNLYSQTFLLTQQWWHNVTTDVRGVSSQHENEVSFMTRQMLDLMSPSNFPATNPEVMAATLREGGMNLLRGWANMVEDLHRQASDHLPVEAEGFVVGETLAATPGHVVARNGLMELIQYDAVTPTVYPEPILLVPAWIMKYYILDLTPEKSLVKYLTEQGFTVFMISWRNPDAADADLGLDDYRSQGVMAALDAIGAICPGAKVHATGYCLGGTLLAIAAAAMAHDGDTRLKDISFFAAQVDFTESGELRLFINESQIAFLEDLMQEQGYLDSRQMAGAFRLLRSNDLIWSRMLHDYLLGQRPTPNPLMSWNADATRMPAKMHSEYLRKLFLDNDFAEGRFKVNGHPVVLSDIRLPVLTVATEWDHVAPWQSVYKIHLFSDADVTFILCNRGHNAGIVPGAVAPEAHYRMAHRPAGQSYLDPDRWLQETTAQDGSWWPAYADWVRARSGPLSPPPQIGAPKAGFKPLCKAPGTYVMRKSGSQDAA